MTIIENLKTEINYECDVLVVGGGIGGIAAALAAARSGKKVLLLERSYMLGGLATAGLVTIYLPLCDGMGRQVSFGLAEELLRDCLKYNPIDSRGYQNWILNNGTRTENDPRFEVDLNPQIYAIVCEQKLLKENVEILYGAYAVSCSVDDNKITSVIIESKSGRQAIKAKTYIDATGDFDLGKYVGCPSKVFSKGNVLASWYYYKSKDEANKLKILGFCDISDEEKQKGKTIEYLVNNRFTGLDVKETSEMMIMSHNSVLNDILKNKEIDELYEPTNIATIPQLRMTRRIVGEYELDEVEMHKEFSDSIGMVSDWRKRGPVYEVPFSTLYNKDFVNLYAAGRCTSVSDNMWDIMRVIPCCAVTGEAAGIAASMSDDVRNIDINTLQNELRNRNVKIHESELENANI